MTRAIERMLMDDIREQKKIGRGFYNKASANGGTRGKALTVECFMKGYETSDCLIVRGEQVVIVPASWYTKQGVLKKAKRAAVEALFAEV